MGRTYTHYVFDTLTYNREIPLRGCRHLRWWWISRDVTAFIQRIRRRYKPLGPLEFLRVIEQHQDWNPHVHCLLYFTRALSVDADKFLDRQLYDSLQREWHYGFSKPEVLKHAGHPEFAFNYALKYFLKQINDDNSSSGSGYSPGNTSERDQLPPKVWPLRGKRKTYFGMPIRLLAWSRGMQYIYAKEQYANLKRKGFNVDIPSKLVSCAVAKQATLS